MGDEPTHTDLINALKSELEGHEEILERHVPIVKGWQDQLKAKELVYSTLEATEADAVAVRAMKRDITELKSKLEDHKRLVDRHQSIADSLTAKLNELKE